MLLMNLDLSFDAAEGQGYLLMELMATDLGAALHNRPERKEDRSYAWPKK